MTGGFFRLRLLDHGIAAPDGILKAADVDALDGARTLIEAAEARARSIERDAQDAYEAEKARGYAEGRQEIAAERAALMIEDQAQFDARLSEMERDIARLVHDCVRQVIEGFDDDALALQVARSALASMRTERRGQLHVAPAALAATREGMADLIAEFPEIELIDIIEDPGLVAPDVRLESKLGVVSFVLDDTLENLRRLLENS